MLRTYLSRSATFVHTLLGAQSEFRPVVLASILENLDEFPVERIHQLTPRAASLPRRVLRRAAARSAGMPSAYAHELSVVAEREGCVAVHAHFGTAGIHAVTSTKQSGLPLMTTFYGFDMAAQGAYDELFEHGSMFVCEGPAMARALVGLGAPEERVRVVKIGIDLDRFPFAPRSPGEPLVILQGARFVPKKGIDVSIRAFAAAKERLGAAELRLVGDGPLRSELEELAQQLGVADSVSFLGMVSYDDYGRILEQAHIGLQPSRTAPDGDTEGGAPTVLLEMQATGIPVVATRHADIPSVVSEPGALPDEEDVDGVADQLVRWARAGEDEWRERLSAARAHVTAEHDVRVTARRVEALYRELIAT